MIFIWILVAIVMFSIIVIIHEFWHFSAARKFGVKVEEFWLWIPPKAKELFTDKKWTVFTLNWLPLWGFVRLKWENPNLLEDKDDPEALSNKSYFAQSVIILGWVFMNFLLAIIIFSILFFVWVKPVWVNNRIDTNLNVKLIPTQEQAIKSGLLEKDSSIILYPIENSIAQISWLQEGDNLWNIDWINFDSSSEVIKYIFTKQNKKINISVSRLWNDEDSKECVKSNTVCNKTWVCTACSIQIDEVIISLTVWNDWKIGTYLSGDYKRNKDFEYKYWLVESIKYWVLETYNQSLLTFKAIWILIKKLVNPETPQERTEAVENMKWPIGIVDLVANSLEAWIIFLLILSAIISINLWVFNLLPIPALDWWRLLFISINALIAKIFWKKAITENLENLIHVFFFIVLIALSILIWYNDVVNIINR